MRSRVGSFPAKLVILTEVIEAPHRVVFVSLTPSRPVRACAEELLEAFEGRCRLRVPVGQWSEAAGSVAGMVVNASAWSWQNWANERGDRPVRSVTWGVTALQVPVRP